MKTPVEELFEKLWETDKDKFAWNGIFTEMRKKRKLRINQQLQERMEGWI